MTTYALLDPIIYSFHDLFGRQNFMLFSAYIWGSLLCPGRHTISNIYLASGGQVGYWSLVKFISRGQWAPALVVQHLVGLVLLYVPHWAYVYDHTHTVKTGQHQAQLHFFRNHRYRKRNTNQSKFHWGHQFAALGVLGLSSPTVAVLFPVWVKLLAPGAGPALTAFTSIISVLPTGLIIFDRGFNNRKYFKTLLANGHQLLCRARKNAVFYYLPTQADQPRRGKRLYGKRADFTHWTFTDQYIPILKKPVSLAHHIVRTKMCPQPVRLVVIRTRDKAYKPYRYFMVYTTELTLAVPTIVRYYKWRWGLETAFRDTKENLGFDHYQVHAEHSIERCVGLAFVAASIARLVALPAFQKAHGHALPALSQALEQMKISWYQPKRWTLGLVLRYLRWASQQSDISTCFSQNQNNEDIKTYSTAAG